MKQEFILLIISPLIFLILFIPFTSAARLPTVNGDSSEWGTILNGFLQTEHTPYGNHSNVTVNGSFSVFNSSNLADKFLFVNESSGFVGIGTANPSTELEVNGSGSSQIRINSQTNNLFSLLSFQESSALLFDIVTLNSNFGSTEPETSNSTHIRSRTSIGNIRIFNYINGDSRNGLIVASNNNVGIGIASPQTKFEVNGTFMVNQSETTGGKEGKVGLWANGTHVGVGIKGSNYLFQVGNVSGTDGRSVNLSNVLFVNESSGRVGIGTASPRERLEVVGNINVTSGNVTAAYFKGDGSLLTGIGGGDKPWNASGTDVYLNNTGSNVGIGTTVPNWLLSIANGSNGNAVNLSSILYINGNTSRVGIGTSTLQYLFQVANSTTDGRSVNLSNVIFVNESSGRVGIGNASTVGELLSVAARGGDSATFEGAVGIGNGLSSTRITDGNTDIALVTRGQYAQSTTFIAGGGTGNYNYLNFQPGGTFAGATSANAKLGVDATTQDFRLYSYAGHILFSPADGKNVGINTTVPNYLLSVANGSNGNAVNLSSILYINGNTSGVGIGTPVPGSMLTVFGGDLNISNSATGTVFYVQNSTGRVGIGTTVPNSALHVVGSINASSTFIAADGTAAAPSYTFNNDSNTGIRKGGGADNISIVTGGADRLTVDSSGRVGIGASDPYELLVVASSGGDSAIFEGTVGIGYGLSKTTLGSGNTDVGLTVGGRYAQYTTLINGGTGNNNYLSFQAGGAYAGGANYNARIGTDRTSLNFNITSYDGHIILSPVAGKNVGVGSLGTIGAPNYLLSVANGSNGNAVNLSSILYINGNTSTLGIGTPDQRYLLQVANLTTNGRSVNLSNVMFVNESSGRVGIRDSEPGYGLDVVADINSDDCFREAGTQVAGTCASDIRLKKNIQPLQGSLNKILQLKPVEFEWKEGIEELGGTIRYVEGRQVGLIAQDVQQVMPHLVKEKDSYLSIEYNLEMQMMLINAIQEQQNLIRTQYIEIQKLTKRISALEEKMK